MALILKHGTLQGFGTYVREQYRIATRERALQLARCILARIQSGDFTDTQVRNFFGLSTTQYNTLKTKWQTLVTAGNTITGAVGE